MEFKFELIIWKKAENVEVAKEEMKDMLSQLSNKKQIYDYDFPISTEIVEE